VELPHGGADDNSGKVCDAQFAYLQARVRDAQRRCMATWRTPAVESTVLRVANEESATFLIFDPGPRRVKLVLGEGGVPLCSYSDGHVPLEVVLLCHELQHGVRHGRKKGIHFRDASGQPISSMLSPQGSGASSQVGVMDQAVGDRTQLAMAAVGGVAAAVPVHIRSCSPQRSMTHCTSNMVAIARPPPQPGALPHPPSPHPIHCQLINVSQAATPSGSAVVPLIAQSGSSASRPRSKSPAPARLLRCDDVAGPLQQASLASPMVAAGHLRLALTPTGSRAPSPQHRSPSRSLCAPPGGHAHLRTAPPPAAVFEPLMQSPSMRGRQPSHGGGLPGLP